MTQAICDITTDEVNVDVVVEPQADTMVEVANRAGGMEQVFHDNTLIGNGNSVDLGVNTEIIATKEYVDAKDTEIRTTIDNKVTIINAEIDANADAIQKTREDFSSADQAIRADMNQADSEIHNILNSHTSELTTLRGNQASLGDQVAGIEEKIPGDASATNQLATKADLKGIGGDFVKKSGDTMTGILTIQAEEDYDPSTPPVGGLSFKSNASPDGFTNRMRQVGNGFVAIEYLLNGKQYSNLVFGDQQIYIDNTENGTGNPVSLGTSNNPWDNVYAKKLNNGADISVPTLGGTLARLEDLIDLRADINEADSELQTQITAQAAEIATKQDQLTAGDNIIISGNTISATGAGGGVGFDVIVVQELPESGEKGIIYLVPKDSVAPDVYDEYVWVTTTSTFELIGSTKVDLTGYVKDTDYANASTAGVIKTDTSFGVKTTSSGFIEAYSENLTRYPQCGPNFIVGKGTLENIKDDYVKRGITENTIVLTDAEKTAAQNWLGVGSGLPDQTDNAGKFLTTDGSKVSWSDKPLVNNGDESKHNFCVGKFTATSGNYNVCVGESAKSYGGDYNTVVGYKSQIRYQGTVIGANVQISNANKQNVAIIASGNQRIFYGEGIESDSFFWVLNGTPYKLCSSDGTIPAERIGNLDFGTMD